MDGTTTTESAPQAGTASPDAGASGAGASTGSADSGGQTPAAGPDGGDPFKDAEPILASLSPESRYAVEPVLKTLKEKHEAAIKSARETGESTYKKEAEALKTLMGDQEFIRWYQARMNPRSVQAQQQQQGQQLQQKAVQSVAPTPDEWADIARAFDPTKFAALMERQSRSIYDSQLKPTIDTIANKNRELDLRMELDQTARRHQVDWDELDKSGLLEHALYNVTDRLGRPMEEAYKQARSAADYWYNKGKAEAVKTVADRKVSSTEGSSTAPASEGVVYARTPDEALTMQIMENMPGGMKRRVMVKK
jgi:hypothetical protein